jgi:hypothetical protein
MCWVRKWQVGFGRRQGAKKAGQMGSVAGVTLALWLGTGCACLFPRTQTTTESRWSSYADVAAAFDKIFPYQTQTNDLKELGFHPLVSPNVKLLTYVEVMQYFMPNQAITKADLNPSVRACIEAQERGQALVVELSDLRTKRHGNLLLDVLGFKRRTHETGWRFKGVILTTNNTVVYKLSSGDPTISNRQKRIKPLGPLQELDSSVMSLAEQAY